MSKSTLTVVFYRTAAGKAPVLEWLRELSGRDRKQLGGDLLRVQENWPIGMPVCRSLGAGLWEVRSGLTGGRIARMIFCLKEGEIFVLHGFMKTTQKTPTHEWALAHKRMKEVLK